MRNLREIDPSACVPTSDVGSWRKALGPGILFAGAAVGVSHLVQSTRAGAGYGLGLLIVVVLANVLKYPAFRFGPQYAAATGASLLEGYRRLGRSALVLYAALTVATMFTVTAVVTVVTAGLVKHILAIEASPAAVSAGILALTGALVVVGRYHWLDVVAKWVMAALVVTTVAATVLAIPRMPSEAFVLLPPRFDAETVAFGIALAGWMPSAIDVAVWQSLWTLARSRDSQHHPTVAESMRDFHIGYIGTAILAVFFVFLGASVLFGRGEALAATPAGFAGQLIDVYGDTLGAWAAPIVGFAALATMFSTTLTVVDGFPRAIAGTLARFRGPEEANEDEVSDPSRTTTYRLSVVTLSIGAIAILTLLDASLGVLVDLATILSFLTAPLLAWLNHRAVLGSEVPEHARPGPGLRLFSLVAMVALGGFAVYYLVVRFI